MEMKVNERKEMKEVYKCDYVYICDNCGRERDREYKLKMHTPDSLYKKNNPEFCSVKCLREWILNSKFEVVEKDPIIENEDGDSEIKTYTIMDLTYEQWRELLNGV